MKSNPSTQRESTLEALPKLLLALGLVSTMDTGCSAGNSSSGTQRQGVEWPPHGANPADGGTADGAAHEQDGGIDSGAAYGSIEMSLPRPHPQTPSELVEQRTGLTLSPEEKLIADTCPRRPLSKNVPNRACTKDAECGDGFCDRGQCSAIYTCMQDLGSRCELDGQCPFLMCIEGRCRSCTTDEECQVRMERPNRICSPPARRAPGRECTGPTGELLVDRKAACVNREETPYCKGTERVTPKQPTSAP